MPKPILFIETPRAGKHNHRFIAPEGYTDGDGALSQWADFARQQAEVAEYFSARREVTQQAGGRTGVEQLILAGVDAKQLSPERIKNIRAFLQQHLPNVERLVTQSIDWDKVTQNIVLRTELNQWQQELEQQLGVAIPAASIKPVNQVKAKRRWVVDYWQVVTLAFLLLVGAAVAQYLNQLDEINIKWSCASYNDGSQEHEQCIKREAAETIQRKNDEEARIKAEAEKQKLAEEQMQQLIAAIGGNRTLVEKELKDLKLSPLKIEERWPVSMFVSHLQNNGRNFVELLWNKPLANLKIENRGNVLQPLVQCRKAIRALMGVTGEVYTPFFEKGDFGSASNAPAVIRGKFEDWAKKHEEAVLPKPNIVTPQRGCGVKPKKDEMHIVWINSCLATLKEKFPDDTELQSIITFGKACDAVKFEP